MKTGKVLVDAGELRAAIARDGKVALYAVYFATDQATLTSESKPQLEEIAKLLQGAALVHSRQSPRTTTKRVAQRIGAMRL